MHALSESEAGPASAARADARIALGFRVLAAITLCLIMLGALVRAHDAGLACPDWPLCFGELIPEIDLQVGFEWSHRLLAGGVALGFAVLGACAWRSTRRGARALISLAALVLTIQIALGALTVWLQLAPWTVAAHLIAGNGFASATLLLSLAFRSRARVSARAPIPAQASSASGLWIAAAALLLLVQLGIGGLVSSRYAAMACPEWPTCSGGVWFPSWSGSVGLNVVHRLTAYALVGCLALAAATSRREPRLRGPTALACMLGVLQLGVGIANVRLGIPAALTAMHTGVAAGIALALVYALHALLELRDERRALGLPAIRARC